MLVETFILMLMSHFGRHAYDRILLKPIYRDNVDYRSELVSPVSVAPLEKHHEIDRHRRKRYEKVRKVRNIIVFTAVLQSFEIAHSILYSNMISLMPTNSII